MKNPSTLLLPLLCAGLLVGGCSSNAELSQAEKQQFQDAIKDDAKKAKSSLSGLAGAVVRGGQLEVGDAQGRPLWRLKAKEMRTQGEVQDGAPKTAVLTDASAELFRSGKPESKFKADTIHLFNTPQGVRLQMNGHVVATSQTLSGAPLQVNAPCSDVDVTKRILTASGGVTAKRGDITLQSPQMTGQTTLQVLKCPTAKVLAPATAIQGQNVVYNWKTNHVVAQNATATRQQTVLSGQKLEADTAAQCGTLTGNVRAKAPNGTASGPRLDFNWKNDRLFVPQATFQGQEATVQTAALTTDSKLHVTNAQNVRVQQNGATLTIQNARGLEKLSQLSGTGVTFTRADVRIEAGAAKTTDWSKENGRIDASGGVTARTSKGTVTARNAVWSGGTNGSILANGDVRITAPDGTLRGDHAQSDAKFQNASLSGSVSGTLRNGTRIKSTQLEKHGENYVASRGATATLANGTLVSASRVEGNATNALATGNATATLSDGTRLHANRVQKSGNRVVATGGVRADLPRQGNYGRVQLTAARIEGSATNVASAPMTASGGITLSTQNGSTVRAKQATYNRATGKIVATGGVTLFDAERHFTQTGSSLVANLNLKNAVLTDSRGQGPASILDGKTFGF